MTFLTDRDQLLPTAGQILTWPLPHRGLVDRVLMRGLSWVARRSVRSVEGIENIAPANDPFILVLNHSTCAEAITVPTFLMLLRGGKGLHFMADWNFRLIPGVNFIYKRAGVITVTHKPARPAFLTALRGFYSERQPVFDVARQHLMAGRSLGIFPEGRVNRDSAELLRGRAGAAQLSLLTGIPIVPAGLVFPDVPKGQRIPEAAAMVIRIGAAMQPPGSLLAMNDRIATRLWHARIMASIADLSGKSWNFNTTETSHDHQTPDVYPASHDRGRPLESAGGSAHDL